MQSKSRDQDLIDNEKNKIAQSLLQDQLPTEFISKHTGLSVQEIEKLREKLLND